MKCWFFLFVCLSVLFCFVLAVFCHPPFPPALSPFPKGSFAKLVLKYSPCISLLSPDLLPSLSLSSNIFLESFSFTLDPKRYTGKLVTNMGAQIFDNMGKAGNGPHASVLPASAGGVSPQMLWHWHASALQHQHYGETAG